jgi:hypothetical protein
MSTIALIAYVPTTGMVSYAMKWCDGYPSAILPLLEATQNSTDEAEEVVHRFAEIDGVLHHKSDYRSLLADLERIDYDYVYIYREDRWWVGRRAPFFARLEDLQIDEHRRILTET